jgi:alkanesulfonate monooxygenase
VFPLLPREQKERVSGPLSGPFGEIVGTSYAPRASQS